MLEVLTRVVLAPLVRVMLSALAIATVPGALAIAAPGAVPSCAMLPGFDTLASLCALDRSLGVCTTSASILAASLRTSSSEPPVCTPFGVAALPPACSSILVSRLAPYPGV
ncbi:hypothetical protein DFJ74DRAFT_686327 [Hyaloraphidium curvatum]|nr:hypothetical protein DFJ74DRAFT_686327 [Hyaloraphidium curvatum]